MKKYKKVKNLITPLAMFEFSFETNKEKYKKVQNIIVLLVRFEFSFETSKKI